jgi:hypothetical protein
MFDAEARTLADSEGTDTREPSGSPGFSDAVGRAETVAIAESGVAVETGAARRSLERAQAELLAALVAGGEAPSGFDGERLRLQARSLIAKRRGSVARALPGLVSALGNAFAREFAAYAEGRPKPPGGSRADARDFVGWLREMGRLPDPP